MPLQPRDEGDRTGWLETCAQCGMLLQCPEARLQGPAGSETGDRERDESIGRVTGRVEHARTHRASVTASIARRKVVFVEHAVGPASHGSKHVLSRLRSSSP